MIPLPTVSQEIECESTPRASLTIFSSNENVLTKHFELDTAGNLVPRRAPALVSGTFRTVSVNPAGFRDLLVRLRLNEALCFGTDRMARLAGRVATKNALLVSPDDDAIARTKDYLDWPEGAGILQLDVDLKDAAPHLPQLPDPPTIDGLREALLLAAPEMTHVPMLGWPSASACICRSDTGAELRSVTGARFYIFVDNAADIPALGTALHQRLVLAGYRFAFISAAGTVYPRSILDTSVWSPERLDFAAGASCGVGLVQRRGDPLAWNLDSQALLTTELLPALSGRERVVFEAVIASTLAAVRSDAEAIRSEYVEEQRAKGRTISVAWNTDGAVEWLDGDHEIVLDDGATVTVDEILEGPARYHGRNCSDPIEPDYRGDNRLARIYTLGQTSGPTIHSYAHGGAVYMLRRSAAEVFRVEQNAAARVSKGPSVACDDHLTDMGNASRFAQHFANHLIFAGGQWLRWDEKRWAACDEVELQEMAKRVVRALFAEAVTAADSDDRKKRTAWALRSESMQRIRAMVDLARGALLVSADALDANPWLVNVENGTLDLRTSELRAHCPADYITKLAPVPYDANATCPRWLGFLGHIMGGDDTLISALQRMTGYSLTGVTTEQVLFLLYGIGANGKSTYLELMREMFGGYAAQTKHTTLLQQKNGDGARPEIIKLRGARLITASEVPSGRQFDSATVKALTGGDTLSERDLYKAPVEFRIEGKLWLAANHRPKIEGDDPAMWRRMRLIPFSVTIPEDERDPDLLGTLRGEMPGIFRWAVEGCREWQEAGLRLPAAVTNATAGYRAEMSSLAAFFQERCRFVRGARTSKKDLYDAFGLWCTVSGDPTIDQGERAFSKDVERHDPGRIVPRKSNVMCWEGIELLSAFEN